MTIWRPPQEIRVKAIGIHWRDGCILASEVYDDAGNLKGVRPLGGSVEFGETWHRALMREFQEELGVEICIAGAPLVIENIYLHEGVTGHEILFIADVLFPEGAYKDKDVIEYHEDNGSLWTARWFELDDLDSDGVALFPLGLMAHLIGMRPKR